MSQGGASGPAGESQAFAEVTRRRFLAGLLLGLGGLGSAVIAVPWVTMLLAPLLRKTPDDWRDVGAVDSFTVGETVKVDFSDPSSLPWSGVSGRNGAWLRRDSDQQFTAFSVNCTHLGCPVRWVPGAGLFMCPCHGGVFYMDGSVAASPPRKPLARFATRIKDGQVQIKSGPLPITTAGGVTGGSQ